jgi:hypothetical protein
MTKGHELSDVGGGPILFGLLHEPGGVEMTNFGNVKATAFVVAQCRAEENAAASPLYRDDVVELFLDDET